MTRPPIIIRTEDERSRVARLVAGLNMAKAWSVIIKPYQKKRSLSQNALMWVWIGEVVKQISADTGTDSNTIHNFFKREFLTPEIEEFHGRIMESWTTTKLTRAEMSQYMNQIYVFATQDLGLLLTIPEELQRNST